MARRKPNILIFICDHLTRRVLGAYGNDNTAAPTIDALAHDGVAVDNVYTPTPLCRPTRAAFWTGRYPHETGVLSNGGRCNDATIGKDVPTVGEVFKHAGYETIHFGKTHDHGGLRGFKSVVQFAEETKPEHPAWPVGNNTHCDRFTANCIIDFLEKRDHGDDPFIAVADFNNPHEICSWVGHNAGKHEDIPVPGDLPTLPSNFETPDLASRPLPIQYLCCSHRRMFQAAKWTRENYRHYLAAFRHYTSRVDREISRVLQALSSMPGGDNSIILLFADHGDSMASHRMVTKQVHFYDETTRVPFIIAGPGIPSMKEPVKNGLASLLDLFPTLCDLAGLDVPAGTRGSSLLPLIHGEAMAGGEEDPLSRDFVVSEWHTEWGFTVSPGRMVRTKRFKYTHYLEGNGEELFDLENDPGEKCNLAGDAAFSEIIKHHRSLLQKHVKDTGDPYFTLNVEVDSRWRSHELGYMNHEGPCAPDFGRKKTR